MGYQYPPGHIFNTYGFGRPAPRPGLQIVDGAHRQWGATGANGLRIVGAGSELHVRDGSFGLRMGNGMPNAPFVGRAPGLRIVDGPIGQSKHIASTAASSHADLQAEIDVGEWVLLKKGPRHGLRQLLEAPTPPPLVPSTPYSFPSTQPRSSAPLIAAPVAKPAESTPPETKLGPQYVESVLAARAYDRNTIHAGTGTPYSVDAAEIYFLQDENVTPDHPAWRALPPKISRDAALRLLSKPPANTAESTKALQRLQRLMNSYAEGRDLPIKTYNDLDALCFHGELKHRCSVRWMDLDDHAFKQYKGRNTYTAAITHPPFEQGNQRIWIRINTHCKFWREERTDVLGSLVHEMIHAWYYLYSGERGCDDFVTSPGEDEGHGYYFMSAKRIIDPRLRSTGLSVKVG